MKYRVVYQNEETFDKAEFMIETDTVDHAIEAVRESIANFKDTDNYYCEAFWQVEDREKCPDFYLSKSDGKETQGFFN